MPALPVIPNVFKCTFEYSSGEATFVNVFSVIGEGSTPSSLAAGLMTSFLTFGGHSRIQSLLSSSVSLDRVTVLALDGSSTVEVVDFPPATFGLGAVSPAPANAALIITLLTGARGRSRRGRMFLGGIPRTSIGGDGARWGASIVADAVLWFQEWLDQLATIDTGVALGVLSIKNGDFHVLTSFVPRTYFGSIRARTEREI